MYVVDIMLEFISSARANAANAYFAKAFLFLPWSKDARTKTSNINIESLVAFGNNSAFKYQYSFQMIIFALAIIGTLVYTYMAKSKDEHNIAQSFYYSNNILICTKL